MDRVACAHPRGAIRIRTPIVGRRSGRRSVRGPTLALAAMNAMRARSDGLVRGAEHSSRLIVRPRVDAGGDGTLQDYATPNHLTPLIYGCYVAIASIATGPLMRAGR